MALHLCYTQFDSIYAFRCPGVNAGSLRSKAPLLAGAHSKPGKLWANGSLSDQLGLTTETTLPTGLAHALGHYSSPVPTVRALSTASAAVAAFARALRVRLTMFRSQVIADSANLFWSPSCLPFAIPKFL